MTPPSPAARHGMLLGVFASALLLRLLRLDHHALWYDEAATWAHATLPRWVDTVMAEANHPPVWWLVTRAWLSVFPGAESALRLPAALCGALAVALTYLLSRRLADPAHVPALGGFRGNEPAAPLWVAALAAVNPFWIEYSQEARMYAALLAESLALHLLYLRHLDRGARGPLVAYALVATLALHTHYFAGFVLAGHATHALWSWRPRRVDPPGPSPWPLLAAQGVGGLLFLPWFLVLLSGTQAVFSHPTPPLELLGHALWRMGSGPALTGLDAPVRGEGPWGALRDVRPGAVGVEILWFVPIALGLASIRRDVATRRFVLSAVLVPVALALLVSLRWTLVSEKYLIFLAPFLLHLAVLGALSVRGRGRTLSLAGLVVLHAVGLLAYHGPHLPLARPLVGEAPYGKEQWRDLHRWVTDRAEPGDVVLLHAPCVLVAWDFYDAVAGSAPPTAPGPAAATPTLPRLPLPPSEAGPERILSSDDVVRLYPSLADAREVFLVLSHQTTADPYHYGPVLRRALERAQPHRAWAVEEVLFPRAWGVRVHRFHATTAGR